SILAGKLADALDVGWRSHLGRSFTFTPEGNIIKTTWGSSFQRGKTGFVLGGSEAGLGVPSSPKNLSVFHDEQRDGFLISWTLPVDKSGVPIAYDQLYISSNPDYSASNPMSIPSNSTSHFLRIPRREDGTIWLEELGFYVVLYGVVDGIPSSPGGVSMEVTPSSMSEHLVTVYSRGIMPNWWPWPEDNLVSINATEGQRHGHWPEASGKVYDSISEKRTFQAIGVTEGRGGI